MGSSKKVTVGYRYYMGLHFGLCHGPVDAVYEVLCGDRSAWIGECTESGPILIGTTVGGQAGWLTNIVLGILGTGTSYVSANNLFGGDEKEGGVVGTLDVMMGEPTQGQNDYLVTKINANIPAFRGILSAVWRGGQVSANNPYVKPWAFRVKRILQGWYGGTAWYPEKAEPLITSGGFASFDDDCSSISEYALAEGGVAGCILSDGTTIYNPANEANNSTFITRSLPGVVSNSTIEFDVCVTGVNPGDAMRIGFTDGDSTWFQFWPRVELSYDAAQRAAVVTHTTLIGDVGLTLNQWYSARFSAALGEFTLRNRDTRELFVRHMLPGVSGNISGIQFIRDGDWGVNVPSAAKYDNIHITGGGFLFGHMNPAHITYQCLTDKSWGMGYPTSAVDDDSFTAAADTLYNEGFGLSMLWSRQETIENFIQIVLDHIGGLLYVRPDTGTFALKLIRSDYDRGALPLYGPSTLVSVEDYQRQAWGETINEITVIYTDCLSGKEAPITVQDMANVQMQGGIVSQTRNYPGIPTAGLAQRVALRDLQTASTPLARVKLTATRAAWQVSPGDVFRLTWPEYGIDDVVYRALGVNRGTLQDGQIIIDAVEDVFGLPDNTYLVEQPSEWEDPSNPPAEAPYRKLLEAPYWDLVRTLSAADMDYVDALSGYLETLAVRPSNDAMNYRIWAKIGAADYADAGNGDFCATATVVETLTKTTTVITLANGVDLDLVTVGGYAIIDDEYVLVSAIDAEALTATISRGVLDTVPVAHTASARIWFADGSVGFSTTEYADTEVLDVKLLPITGQGALEITEAPSDTITFDQRQYRPYPPAGLLFNGLAWPVTLDGGADIVLTWAHRDRTLQTAYIVEQDEAGIGPEASVTYSLEVADAALDVLHSETGITDETATVPLSALVSNELLRFRLWSVRGGLVSLQMHEHFATISDSRVTEAGDARITEAGDTRITN